MFYTKADPFLINNKTKNICYKFTIFVSGVISSSAFGETYNLTLACNGTWWSRKTSYKLRRWLTFECIDSGESLGLSSMIDIECIRKYQLS